MGLVESIDYTASRVIGRNTMRFSFSVMLLAAVFSTASAQTVQSETGLEVDPGYQVWVVVEDLPPEARDIGLAEDRILSTVELQLRRNGVPVTRERRNDPFLYVNINVSRSVFSINLMFPRTITFAARGELFECSAPTWLNGAMGQHSGDASVLLDGLKEYVDLFSNDFLRANEHWINEDE